MDTLPYRYIYHEHTPLGDITMSSDGTALTGLWFDGQKGFPDLSASTDVSDPSAESPSGFAEVFRQTSRWLSIYFSGQIPDFTPPLAPEGTDFQKRVWDALLAIPFGQTASYGEIARNLSEKSTRGSSSGEPSAPRPVSLSLASARAVGSAVARNPISLIIPCHRVVGSDGTLTGYAGGLDRKLKLLELEHADLARFRLPYRGYIGVFDSGVGGISVLQELVRELPDENFLYYGDNANAPYGDKSAAEILRLSERVMDYLLSVGVKAAVIACNTATSAAASTLRSRFRTIPIIGIEPAIKPAALRGRGRKILVMATAATLHLDKYLTLEKTFEEDADFIPLPCSGLVELIEKGNPDSPEIRSYLKDVLAPYVGNVDGIVLGCTHYPFVRREILEIMGNDVDMYNGAEGTARELHRRLKKENLLIPPDAPGPRGRVVFRSSDRSPETIRICRRLFALT